MNAIRRNIPNCITCLNVAAGVLAIISAMRGYEEQWGITGIAWAYIFIGIAAVADFLDGFAARLLNAYSGLGKELDSLCDLVSFGVAPAIILYQSLDWAHLNLQTPEWVKWTAVLVPVFAALRLARFNLDTRQSENFIGLPVPANAIFWIGYTALLTPYYKLFHAFGAGGSELMAQWWCLLPILLVECWLMVSPVRMFSLKFKTFGWSGNQWRWLLILTAGVLVFCMGVPGLMWLVIAYVLYGIFDAN